MRDRQGKPEVAHKRHGLQPNLLMAQRFLASRAVLAKIIAAANLTKADTVLEIGAGLGTLTIELAKKARQVLAIEKDQRLVAVLDAKLRQAGITNVRLISGDILKLPIPYPLTPNPYKVVANVPYYLTGRLLKLLLTGAHPPKEMFLMVQKEVAERITAKPPKMNLLALAVQAYGEPEILFPVSRAAFSPPPKVDSAFIRIRNIRKDFFQHNALDEATFFKIASAAFRGKRKTLENALAKNLTLPKRKVAERLEKLGLAGKRPEMLALGDWAMLAKRISTATIAA